jgi:hypothetical protein
MIETRDRILSAREAARIIYNAPDPTSEQVDKVRAKIARGHLAPSPKGHWTTTSGSVADYLAARAAQRANDAVNPELALTGRTPKGGPQTFSGFYRRLLKDYFLAVALRRRLPHRTRRFAQAVLAGQIGVLVLSAALAVGLYRQAMALTTPAEHLAIETWLETQVGPVKVQEWFPTQLVDGDSLVRVRYRYFVNRRPIDTDRVFAVGPDRSVREVHSD